MEVKNQIMNCEGLNTYIKIIPTEFTNRFQFQVQNLCENPIKKETVQDKDPFYHLYWIFSDGEYCEDRNVIPKSTPTKLGANDRIYTHTFKPNQTEYKVSLYIVANYTEEGIPPLLTKTVNVNFSNSTNKYEKYPNVLGTNNIGIKHNTQAVEEDLLLVIVSIKNTVVEDIDTELNLTFNQEFIATGKAVYGIHTPGNGFVRHDVNIKNNEVKNYFFELTCKKAFPVYTPPKSISINAELINTSYSIVTTNPKVCGYHDPNWLLLIPKMIIEDNIQPLIFEVGFTNDGNVSVSTAEVEVVLDAELDPNTVSLVNYYDKPYRSNIKKPTFKRLPNKGNVVRWRINNANLMPLRGQPPLKVNETKGWFRFQVTPKITSNTDRIIECYANVYFGTKLKRKKTNSFSSKLISNDDKNRSYYYHSIMPTEDKEYVLMLFQFSSSDLMNEIKLQTKSTGVDLATVEILSSFPNIDNDRGEISSKYFTIDRSRLAQNEITWIFKDINSFYFNEIQDIEPDFTDIWVLFIGKANGDNYSASAEWTYLREDDNTIIDVPVVVKSELL